MAFRPYLFFGGNCREAMTHYQTIFGGELLVMTMKDVPDETPPPGMEDVVIHAAVTIDEDHFLMASDDMSPDGTPFGPVPEGFTPTSMLSCATSMRRRPSVMMRR